MTARRSPAVSGTARKSPAVSGTALKASAVKKPSPSTSKKSQFQSHYMSKSPTVSTVVNSPEKSFDADLKYIKVSARVRPLLENEANS